MDNEKPTTHVSINEYQNFPVPNDLLEWRLRYGKETLTGSERLLAASIVAAYKSLMQRSQKDRNEICKHIKKAPWIYKEWRTTD